MRSSLYELPVLLTMLRGGAVSGAAAYLLLLPRRWFDLKHRGLRTGLWRGLLFALADIAVIAACFGVFAYSLVKANGGEPRLYAAAGFISAHAAAFALIKKLLF